MDSRDPILFAIDASREFGMQVGRELGVALSAHEERDFEDGEHKIRPLVNVRNRDVFVLHALYSDATESANDKLCRLLFMLGALRDAGAARITAVVPYLCYARKDRQTKLRDPVTTRYVAGLFESVGLDHLVTMDVHNLAAFQNAFHRATTDHLQAVPLFARHFAKDLKNEDIVVASPDVGGIKRADLFRQALGRATDRTPGSAFVEKRRSGVVVSGEAIVGDVEGKAVVFIDDLVSSGGTLARAADACRERGAVRVQAAVTHGLFAGDAEKTLGKSALERLVVADTVPPSGLSPGFADRKIVLLGTAGIFARAIRCIHEGEAIDELLEYPE